MKRIVVLGSTGSIGRQTLDIVRSFPEEFEVVGLAAGNDIELFNEQVKEFQPKHVCCINPPAGAFPGLEFTAMEDMVCLENVDQVMVALMGSVGLIPTLNALKAGKSVAVVEDGVEVLRVRNEILHVLLERSVELTREEKPRVVGRLNDNPCRQPHAAVISLRFPRGIRWSKCSS